MEYTAAVYTDAGIRKANNQDSLCLRRVAAGDQGEILLAAVADGMGGLSRGEVASAQLIGALEAWFDRSVGQLARAGDFVQARQQLRQLLEEENRRLAAWALPAGGAMGSTLAVLLAVGRRYLTVNVGDSRVYVIKGGKALRLTEDQSLVEREVQQGRITREEARRHPQRNVLLQCVGAGRDLSPAFGEGTVEDGEVYLLCSDGLCHELEEEELAQALLPRAMATGDDLRRALETLAERCKGRGEEDNITAVAARSAESAVPPPQGFLSRLLGRRSKDDSTSGNASVLTPVEAVRAIHVQAGGPPPWPDWPENTRGG